uniref:F-box domain-containing protein n=1 Tax=Steinernema glaseri TaxID=37863 RepID=A0A1I7YLP3_9BILA
MIQRSIALIKEICKEWPCRGHKRGHMCETTRPLYVMGALPRGDRVQQSCGPPVQLTDDVLLIILNYVKQSGLTFKQFFKYRRVSQQWSRVVEELSNAEIPRRVVLKFVRLERCDRWKGLVAWSKKEPTYKLYVEDTRLSRRCKTKDRHLMKISDLRYFPKFFSARFSFNGVDLEEESDTDHVIHALYDLLVAYPEDLQVWMPPFKSGALRSFRRIMRCSAASAVTKFLHLTLNDTSFQEVFCKCLPSYSTLQIGSSFHPGDCLNALERLSSCSEHLRSISIEFIAEYPGVPLASMLGRFLQALTTHGKAMTIGFKISKDSLQKLCEFPFGEKTYSSDHLHQWLIPDLQFLLYEGNLWCPLVLIGSPDTLSTTDEPL